MTDLEHELAQMVVEELRLEHIQAEELRPETPLFGGAVGLTSIDALELVVVLERRYKIQIKDLDVDREALSTIGAMAKFIRKRAKCEERELQ